jgi:hypothetical protein
MHPALTECVVSLALYLAQCEFILTHSSNPGQVGIPGFCLSLRGGRYVCAIY